MIILFLTYSSGSSIIAPARPEEPKGGYYCAPLYKKLFVSSRCPPLVWLTEQELNHHYYLSIQHSPAQLLFWCFTSAPPASGTTLKGHSTPKPCCRQCIIVVWRLQLHQFISGLRGFPSATNLLCQHFLTTLGLPLTCCGFFKIPSYFEGGFYTFEDALAFDGIRSHHCWWPQGCLARLPSSCWQNTSCQWHKPQACLSFQTQKPHWFLHDY